ncbi:DUF5723 family protein [Robiginitalea sp. M366]|uniref:DUF5723 family protein n=1 Tax=Robiginitalea aestuariiviva TaxID=3036903 RepID=UPI00240DFD40|nr:DUF5723 family protein [Robiginitalea aestuariiviva]MDG1572085.1 DUF5723 family protein [Robiginitalea aestuariiviva]
MILLACLCLYPLRGQNKALLYDFTEIPQSLLINPGAQTSLNWYAGVPLLSGFSFQAGSSGITVDDIFAADGLDINDKVRQRAVYGMTRRDELSGAVQLEILSGGFRSGRRPSDFYSFGTYLEGDAIGYWPQDLAILAWEGNANQYGRKFDLGHLKTRGELTQVFHFGINRQVSSGFTIGARAKIYSGILHFNSSRNQGYFLTQEGQNNLVANTLSAQMALRTSGLDALYDIVRDETLDRTSATVQYLRKRALFGGDLGLGIDLGFSRQIGEQWWLTASLLDLGFMMHTSPRNFYLEGTATVEGVEVILPDALADPNRDFWQDLVDEVEALVPFTEDNRNYVSFRPTKFYSSLRYDFGEPVSGGSGAACDCDITPGGRQDVLSYRNALGAQLYAINRPRGPQGALSVFYLRRVGRWLAVKAAYTADKFTMTNLGLGVQFRAGPVQLYLMGDNLLGYRNVADSHYASFQFGLNILSSEAN